MTHNEVMKTWIGNRTYETVKLGYQCVAWVKKYCKERGWYIGNFGGNAITGWMEAKPFNKDWKRVVYTGSNYPSEGDIIFWNIGKDGHTSVANRFCNPWILRHTDQNGGGHEEEIQARWSGYKNVVGWFHHN